MRIICPTCASHYEIERDKIGADGQLVRCAHCRDVWLVQATDTPAHPADAAVKPPSGRPERDVNAFAAAVRAEANPPPTERLIDFETARIKLRRQGGGTPGRSRMGSASLIGLGAVCAASLALVVGLRTSIVTHLPAAGPAFAAIGLPVNVQGLALRDVRSVMVAEGGKTVLNLEGEIENLRDGPTPVPNLTVVVRDDAQVPLYTWTTAAPKNRLNKGETIAFRSRLDAPPTDGRDVRVTFADAGTTMLPARP